MTNGYITQHQLKTITSGATVPFLVKLNKIISFVVAGDSGNGTYFRNLTTENVIIYFIGGGTLQEGFILSGC